MTLRGRSAIVGIGETAHMRAWPGRTALGLAAEAAAEAIADVGLRREDIDGLMTVASSFDTSRVAEYIGIKPTTFAVAAGFQGDVPYTYAIIQFEEGRGWRPTWSAARRARCGWTCRSRRCSRTCRRTGRS